MSDYCSNAKILITGAAGFIGFHTSRALLQQNATVIGFDNCNDYYDPQLKQDRLAILEPYKNFHFVKGDLVDQALLHDLFHHHKPDIVLHLAAQAGVRYSIDHPHEYGSSNLTGFLNISEAARNFKPAHFIFASSSSVYGSNTKLPYAVGDAVDHPISLYAATKRANELMAHAYAHLYQIPTTGLRFFTVYGPWGRPDMAYYKFTKSLYAKEPIAVFNYGDMKRDFTYIDDIVEGIIRLIPLAPEKNDVAAPFRVLNIGHHKPEKLMDMIQLLEAETGQKAICNFKEMQAGDVYATYADIEDLKNLTGFAPKTPLSIGLRHFVAWYRDYYKLGNGPTSD
jgi:UDP-glucuronate 4-epimerase